MKALIWIIILALIGWGLWYWLRDSAPAGQGNNNAAAAAEALGDQSQEEVDLSEFQDKG